MAEKSEKASSQAAEAQERRSISAQIVHEAVRKEGEEELARPAAALAWSGLGAGLSMGLSMIGQGVILARIELYFASFALNYLLPVLVGNTAGGVVIVALLNHAQVTATD